MQLLRHPSRLMIPLARWLPPDIASMYVFVCAKKGVGESEPER